MTLTLLANRRRRIDLYRPRDAGRECVPAGDLAVRIAAWTAESVGPATVSVRSIGFDLAHGLLTRLDAAGVVDFGGDVRRVAFRGADRAERFLGRTEPGGLLPWHRRRSSPRSLRPVPRRPPTDGFRGRPPLSRSISIGLALWASYLFQ